MLKANERIEDLHKFNLQPENVAERKRCFQEQKVVFKKAEKGRQEKKNCKNSKVCGNVLDQMLDIAHEIADSRKAGQTILPETLASYIFINQEKKHYDLMYNFERIF